MRPDITETQKYMQGFSEEEQEFAIDQHRMVEEQLKARGIMDMAVLDAMNTAPREHFPWRKYLNLVVVLLVATLGYLVGPKDLPQGIIRSKLTFSWAIIF